MHWFSWKRMCQPKDEGGMGFREFQAFNQAIVELPPIRGFFRSICLGFFLLQFKAGFALCFVDSSLLSIQVPLQVESASRSVPRWSPPSAGFKFNVDAAVDAASGKFGVGIVARDQWGCLKSAAALIFPSFFSVAVAEARAVFEGFKLAVSSSLSPFFVESDSLEIVKLCGGFSSTRCEVNSIVQDILFHFGCFADSLAFVSRNCNNVAHCLAKWALWSSSNSVWFCSFPDWLLKLVKENFCSSVF
ncbi:hypothetical protein ACOSQ4_024981 [Xanthoceras sorbifolium]